MRLKCILLILVLKTIGSFSQQSGTWYFGWKAGIKFNADGTITALTDGQANVAGCTATISDEMGQLLFYTDGTRVYTRTHTVMPNGTGLMGDFETSQTAIIVQKPGSDTLFYIFTLDDNAGPDGFRYSVVDMSLNGGLGAVTNEKNILVYTPSAEKMAIVKHANNTDFWVVTHGWNNNSFYSYLLTDSGLNAVPVISNAGTIINGPLQNTHGHMKISPDGTKLAICNSGINAELLDFNSTTGAVSNATVLYTPAINGDASYGAEFSPNSEVLYLTIIPAGGIAPRTIKQFDLTSNNIVATAQTILSLNNPLTRTLQLGPDGKIYFTQAFTSKLGVINNPNIIGLGCNPQINAIDLAGRRCLLGLPLSVTSYFFSPTIELTSSCVGQPASFSLNVGQAIADAVWDFGDGNTATGLNPSHTYTAAGNYTVTVTATSANGTRVRTRTITVSAVPTAAQPNNLSICDPNNDGFAAFDLTAQNNAILNGQPAMQYQIKYFASAADYNSNTPIANPGSFINAIAYQPQNIIAEVSNIDNANCKSTTSFSIQVFETPTPATAATILPIKICDDTSVGSDTDSRAIFDLTLRSAAILNGQSAGNFTLAYFKDSAYLSPIADPAAYPNTTATETIYIKITNNLNASCFATTSFVIEVLPLPIINPTTTLRQCDDDGVFAFDTANLQASLLNGLTNVSVNYFAQDGTPLSSPLPNPFTTATQTLTVKVTSNTANTCTYTAALQFIVDDLPEIFPIPTLLTTVCDNEIDPSQQNGSYPFDSVAIQNAFLGAQAGLLVNYFDSNGNSLPSPLPNPFNSTTQNITVRVSSPSNTACFVTTVIPLIVNPVPNITLTSNEVICADDATLTKVIDGGLIDPNTSVNFSYAWYKNGIIIPNADLYNYTANSEGTYTVRVTNASGCSRTRTITVVASDAAVITNVTINDLSDNNSIIVTATGQGDYVYSIDGITYQTSNMFTNVASGTYTVFVKDLYGCGTSIKEINVLGIPKFFTPNGDGHNDFWNIKGINNTYRDKITINIFDRYGKLLKQISPLSAGWDGTLNHQPLPSTDYWYFIQLDNRIVKGHFALIR